MEEVSQSVALKARVDSKQAKEELTKLQQLSKKFGDSFTSSIEGAIKSGKSFEDTLRSLALNLSQIALQAALDPLKNSASNTFGNFMTKLIGGAANAAVKGSSESAAVTAMAKGGIVSSPTLFGAGASIGLMGEAGPEAVLPLARGADGRLGVGTAAQSAPVNVVFNITTPDVAGFQKSQAQIATMLTRTVQRGRRGL